MTLWAASLAGPAFAFLGGFEDQDGYNNDYTTGSGPFGNGASSYNVFYYNAGSYGTNNGGPGGGPVDIANNTGLWRQLDAISAVGNRYAIAHAQVGIEHSYSGDSMLGLRNDTSGAASLIARYFLDDRDFDTIAPGSSLATIVDWSIRLCPDAVSSGGAADTPVFNWTFRDSELDAGLMLGWNENNTIIYKKASDLTWTTSSYTLDRFNYDRIDLHMDNVAKTWYLDAFDVSANQVVNIVSGSTLDAAMGNLTTIDWTLSPNQTKTYFDESNFSVVPEPSSSILCLVAFTALCRRRRAGNPPSGCASTHRTPATRIAA